MLNPTTLFKALVDETRLRCLMLMVKEDELCVCELGFAIGESQPKISRHLAMLRKNEVVQDRREGQWIYYRIHPSLPDWARTVIKGVADGALEIDPFQDDQKRLVTMPNRPVRCGCEDQDGERCG
ncbi:MAG: metalloregulator ArsR/SmtB family transcription factor [Magnetococcales bacterium]|nr:metalloregulator ArsR/SmtB family transcription factor [Magnetococcales bacterium]